uniref:Protein kinase domain-containing protein n=1 Tax=Kryptolebias marmoratus TaxID=37003 RepID=A0A3Q3B7F2_KRYMA
MAENLKTSGSGRPETSTFEAEVGAEIKGKLNDYSIAAILRYGNFSNIATCRKEKTEEVFVLKCIKKKHYNSEERELKALKCLKSLDPDKNNIVRFFECFEFKDCICLAFEKLDINLQEFMIRRNCRPLRVSEVRAIAHQMLVALKALTQIRITHANIKPESILLVDHLAKPFKVKLTDFGAAAETKKLSEVVIPLTYGYSAPEMFWDSPLDSSVDIWGLGCTLAYIFLGQNLYPTDCEYNYATGKTVKHTDSPCDHLDSLDDLVKNDTNLDFTELEDLKAFIDFLKDMLKLNPTERVFPGKAFLHSFLTMEHLDNSDNIPYINSAHKLILKCRLGSSNDSGDSLDSDLVAQRSLQVPKPFSELQSEKGDDSMYEIEEVLGCGKFGKVVKCHKKGTNEHVALKVMIKGNRLSAAREAEIFKRLRRLDPDKNNIVRFYSCFKYKTCFCFEFELLDISLYDFMERREWKPLSVAEIRPIAQQMLVALTALKSIGVTHSDIKPANILLVNQESKPFKVKLIDFGASCMTSNFTQAPEVYLGLRPDESVDMWGLGCTLLTPKQYIRVTRTFTDENGNSYDHLESLDDLQKMVPDIKDPTELGDLNAFIDLIKNMLVVDPLKRILPADALNHKYISMEHLNEVDKSPYRTMAK